jgi:hypothetical protein
MVDLRKFSAKAIPYLAVVSISREIDTALGSAPPKEKLVTSDNRLRVIHHQPARLPGPQREHQTCADWSHPVTSEANLPMLKA